MRLATQVSNLANDLTALGLPTIVLSMDDFYFPHEHQARLASNNPRNPLIQHRGQPSTHDLPLALSVLSNLLQGMETKVPSYDKSAFSGQGDRAPLERWNTVNATGEEKKKIVILEGWCVGFRAVSPCFFLPFTFLL